MSEIPHRQTDRLAAEVEKRLGPRYRGTLDLSLSYPDLNRLLYLAELGILRKEEGFENEAPHGLLTLEERELLSRFRRTIEGLVDQTVGKLEGVARKQPGAKQRNVKYLGGGKVGREDVV